MSKNLVMEIDAIASSSVEASPESKEFTSMRSTIWIVVLVIIAASAALMLALIHELGSREGAAVIFGVAALAGGVIYTLQKFLRGPVKCHTHTDDEEI